jgi:hypothetical protein
MNRKFSVKLPRSLLLCCYVSKVRVCNFVPDRLKKDLSAGEILALLSNIMIERASQGRLKGLRFGMSKR